MEMGSGLLRDEFLAMVRSAIAIREEYRETGVVVEAEEFGSGEMSFLLMPPGLANEQALLLTLSFAELETLDELEDRVFHDTVREWLEKQVQARCNCPKCRARRGEKPPGDEQIERQLSRYRRFAR